MKVALMSAIDLVTGASGFVGKALVRALRADGRDVRALDLKEMPGVADAITGSVTDPAVCAAACAGVDRVFHLAGVADLWSRDAEIFERVNVGGARAMLAAARNAKAKKFVFCSSLTTLVAKSARIGASEADESLERDPAELIGAYPQSKRRGELLTIEAARAGLDAVIAMPTEPLGPGDDAPTPPTKMILDFANGRTPAYIDCILNFVPVDDLARGMIAAADRGAPGERYLLGGENISMRALLVMIERATGRPMPKTRLPYAAAYAAGLVDTHLVAALTQKAPRAPLTGVRLAGRRVTFSSAKAERELGWRAGPAAPALRAMLQWAEGEGLLRAL